MTDPSQFPRQFAQAFGSQDHATLARLFAEDGSLHSLTGRHLEGRKQIEAGLAEEFAGLSRMARLVTGRTTQRALGDQVVVLHQRFVVTGLRGQDGGELPRLGALLTAVLYLGAGTWEATAATFAVVED